MCALTGPSRLFLWLGSGSKIFLEPINIDHEFSFWKCNSYLFVFNAAKIGPFLHVSGPLELFLELGSGSAGFWGGQGGQSPWAPSLRGRHFDKL